MIEKTEKRKESKRETEGKRKLEIVWRRVLEMLYPTTCVFCGAVASEGICEECRKEVKLIQEPRCKKCGKPVRYEEQEYCYDCQKTTHLYEQGRSLWLHKPPVSQSVYQFKYGNRRVFAEYYAGQMAEQFSDLLRLWQIEVIVPVPIHKSKRKRRGYNQAEVLAKELSRRVDIPVEVFAVLRVQKTKPLKTMNPDERRKALSKAFSVEGDWKPKRNILLIDDIYTTGSTIDEIARIMKEKGVQKVYFLTISVGQGF